MKKTMSLFLAVLTALSICTFPAQAAQEDHYHDPAENWMSAANRTNELDVNSIVSNETFMCYQCQQYTAFWVYRAPEYSRDGQTALTRNVKYSDGTMRDGETVGVILDGVPGVDSYYTGYHWCKAVCQTCGTTNSNDVITSYGYGKNIYWLFDCAADFQEKLPETVTYEYTDSAYHTKTTATGSYCSFCFGTHKQEASVLEKHDLKHTVTPQLANQRFVVKDSCSICEYEKTQYVAAKSVVADYFGVADGQPHTLTVSDLSEAGVTTQIRYGNSAESCTLTSAPNFTEEGQNVVYYEITYTYDNTDMVETGVAYVWLRDENTNPDGTCICGEKDCGGTCQEEDKGCGGDHTFTHLDSVSPSCLTLGYDRYLCTDCGIIEKRDYENALGHIWQSVVIRDADCETTGKTLNICGQCGQVQEKTTEKSGHVYAAYSVKATCTNPGYQVKECEVCGDRQITDITSVLSHSYESHILPATCETGGHTTHLCEGCGSSFVTDHTKALGHEWDEGNTLTNATCMGGSVMEYHCIRCEASYLDGTDANGHIPGEKATCTTAQTCTECGVVLAVPTGHKDSGWIIDKKPTLHSEGSRHKECETCKEVLETESIEKLYDSADTDSRGEALVGGYLVIVTDTDTRNPVAKATVGLNKDGSLSIRLPDGRLLDYADQTTIAVQLVEDESPAKELPISVTDRNGNFCEETTNAAGKVTVPDGTGSTNEDGMGSVGYEDEDGNRFTITVKVEDHETGRPIEDAEVSVGKTGNITVILPDGRDMSEDDRITITVLNNEKEPQEDVTVIVKDDLGNTAKDQTDEDGKLTVPDSKEDLEKHGAYILGYPDGTFGPSKSMTRAEASAIFARILAETRGDSIPDTAATKFEDISATAWYSGYVKYLSNFGIVTGRTETKFAPNAAVTRAEFTAMAVRFFEVCEGGSEEIKEQYAAFVDVDAGYWAAEYIQDAALNGWVEGYGDGTFRADAHIKRSEVVTLMNRLLDREADREYIAQNLRKLNTFPDVTEKHWAYYAVMEAANAHTADMDPEETWVQ